MSALGDTTSPPIAKEGINRALLLGLATVLTGAGYVLTVVVVGSVLGDSAEGFGRRRWPRPHPNRARVLGPAQVEALLVSLYSAMQAQRELTRGVFPAQLTRSGLPTALGSLLARREQHGVLTINESAQDQRFDSRVEAAAYFCVAEATLPSTHRLPPASPCNATSCCSR